MLVLIRLLKTPRFKYMQPHMACRGVMMVCCGYLLLRQIMDVYGTP